MNTSEAQRLKELEKESARLKRLLAERDLALDALQEYLAKKSPIKQSATLSWLTCSNAGSHSGPKAAMLASTGPVCVTLRSPTRMGRWCGR